MSLVKSSLKSAQLSNRMVLVYTFAHIFFGAWSIRVPSYSVYVALLLHYLGVHEVGTKVTLPHARQTNRVGTNQYNELSPSDPTADSLRGTVVDRPCHTHDRSRVLNTRVLCSGERQWPQLRKLIHTSYTGARQVSFLNPLLWIRRSHTTTGSRSPTRGRGTP